MHKCLGENCTRWITHRFAICQECEKVYGRHVCSWPAWLRYYWADIQREWRQERRAQQQEILQDEYE